MSVLVYYPFLELVPTYAGTAFARYFPCAVDSAGRILVPSELRHQFGIEPGCDLILSADAAGIHLQTFAQAVRAAQEALAPYGISGKSVVDELIGEPSRGEERTSAAQTATRCVAWSSIRPPCSPCCLQRKVRMPP